MGTKNIHKLYKLFAEGPVNLNDVNVNAVNVFFMNNRRIAINENAK